MSVFLFEATQKLTVCYKVEADTPDDADRLFGEFYEKNCDWVCEDIDRTCDIESDWKMIAGYVVPSLKQDENDWNYRAPHINLVD